MDRIEAQHRLNALPRWTLEYRLFRETSRSGIAEVSLSGENSKAHEIRYLQLLRLSHHPDQSYLAVTTAHMSSETSISTPTTSSSRSINNEERTTIVTIPPGGQTEDFVQMMFSKFGLLWTQRQILQVNNGQAFEAGDFRVKVGEVRQGQGSSQQSKGLIVELEWMSGNENDWAFAEPIIMGFWKGLEIRGAKEYLWNQEFIGGFGTIIQWCEALRVR